MPLPRVVLVHGAGTTAHVWDRVRPLLLDVADVVTPERPSTGDLPRELDALGDVEGAVVVGVSGGATLGLALAASDVPLAGAVLHEPAVGSLVPGLLDHVLAGWAAGGVAGFGTALYGPTWDASMAADDPDAVGRDLAMFRRFQPSPVAPAQGPVVVTVGADSPPARHAAADALRPYGVEVRVLRGCGHFVHHDAPAVLAAAVRDLLRRLGD
ncbi:alpha/beta fold hydrolase [Cellulomonas septica]|uniref:Alpha/beta hydrolase n=1 Tax=Cellulomonas septica TaxID=285080 RepID=A0ABX1K0I1_9CELL|nr:alpha/beta hydrolase [Cellulomonas septica]NKY39065.1 alpha/beta hydrolase [Cellulomonas septica]